MNPVQGQRRAAVPSSPFPAVRSIATTGCACAKAGFSAQMARRASMAWWKRMIPPSSCHRRGDASGWWSSFAYTIQERALELPQGGWEMEVENPEDLARGELKEEMGLDAAQMTCLGNSLDRLRLHPAAAARLSGHRPVANRTRPRRRGA